MKKSLRDFAKTRHFKERQKERKVSDRDVIRAIYEGELVENDHGKNFVLGNLKVTVDFAHEVLITVHPGEKEAPSRKLLSKEEASALRNLIESRLKLKDNDKPELNEFLKYVEENRIKKM